MPERNLLREGFIDNTVTVSGVVSGTQFVTIQERNALVDEDFTSTALTVSGGELVALRADFGARMKLDEIQYYTDEPTVSGFSFSVSDDDITYFDITMTGTPPRYAGFVPIAAASGSPRYVRLEHSPTSDAIVQEWRATNDETLVDFGSAGTQTEAEIVDSPIGKPSDTVTELKLFNQFSKSATGFVFIDETGDAGDDNIEIALSQSGPWFGRNTLNSVQPDEIPWEKGDFNTGELRIVPSGAYSVNFADDIKGWTTSGFTSNTTAENSLKGINSTLTGPSFRIDNNFGGTTDFESPVMSTGTFGTDPTAFGILARDYDSVKATLTIPNIPQDDLLEHPRLYWRDQGEPTYDVSRSIEATNSGITFSNQPQDFFFDVGNIPTWSGVVRSFSVSPWTTVTGLGFSAHINNFEVFHSSEQDRLALVAQSPASGTQAFGGGSTLSTKILLAMHSRVTQACIITGIEYWAHPPCVAGNAAFFLARFKEGGSFPNPGSNFEVKHIHLINEVLVGQTGSTLKLHEPVFWGAEPGDFIGFGWSSDSSCGGTGQRYTRSTGQAADQGWETSGFIPAGTNTSTLEAVLDADTFTDANTRYNIRYQFIVNQPVVANGTFTTPIFDTAAAPGLTSARLESTEENGTSVDTSGGLSSAENTLNARASVSPPKTSPGLGQLNTFPDNLNKAVVSYRLNAGYANAEDAFQYLGSADLPDNLTSWSLNTENTFLSAISPADGPDADSYIENYGACLFYHEVKDELWVLNVMLSGTVPNDIYPVWDRYDIDTGRLISTDAIGGTINYSYFHPDGSSNSDIDARIFEPVAFLPDYDREEIYIITRLPDDAGGLTAPIAVGSNRYLGFKTDLDGNFKNVIWDADSVAFDPNLPEGDAGSQQRPIRHFRDITYDGSYFYVLTQQFDFGEDGKNIYIYKWGIDDGELGGSEPDTIKYLQNIEINSISGLGTIGTDTNPVRWLEYNKRDGLFYLGVEGSGAPNSPDDRMYAIRLSPDENEVFTATTEGPQNVSYQLQPFPRPETFRRTEWGANDTSGSYNWRGVGNAQDMRYITDVAFIESRNSFVSLTMEFPYRTKDFFDVGQTVIDYYAYKWHNTSFITEVGAGGVFESEVPSMPAEDDAIWGTLSGTLTYNLVQENSALFPTGQFSQLQYQLNADSSSIKTPYLNKSQISQGLRVESIPAEGTKSIYLRTNIPEGTSVAEQTSRLKVFWELQE